jgi:hypothetical protein
MLYWTCWYIKDQYWKWGQKPKQQQDGKANNNNNVGNQNPANPGATLSPYPKAQMACEVFTSPAKGHLECNTVSSSLVSNIVKIAMIRFAICGYSELHDKLNTECDIAKLCILCLPTELHLSRRHCVAIVDVVDIAL